MIPGESLSPTVGSIITHNAQNTQPNFLESGKKIRNWSVLSHADSNRFTATQAEAFKLFDMGLNVFPQPRGKKGGLPWKRLQYTRLNRDHQNYGLAPLFSGDCNIAIMCGRTSNNLFVIDCETPEALRYHISQLQERNLPLWVAKTARGGHIYLFSVNGEVQNVDSNTLRDTEIKGSRGYVLAPPSLHPNGEIYEWLICEGNQPPTVHTNDINWLTSHSGLPINLMAKQVKSQKLSNAKSASNLSPLSRATQDYLKNGHTTPEGNRNNCLFRAACDLAGNGYSFSETSQTLLSIAVSSGLSKKEVQQTIHSAYSRKRTPSRPNSNNQRQDTHSQYAVRYLEIHHWEGRTANSQRAIFYALAQRAQVSCNEEGLFRASIREISAIARIGTATVQRHLRTLIAKKLIIKCGRDHNSQSTLWKFGERVYKMVNGSKTDTLARTPPWLRCSVSILNAGDSLERGSLGFNGHLLYRLLCDVGEALLPKAIAERVRLRIHQVKYVLAKLKKFGLIRRVKQGWLAVKMAVEKLNELAAEVSGTLGKGKARRERYAQERSVYVGKMLFLARVQREGWAFRQAVYDQRAMMDEMSRSAHKQEVKTMSDMSGVDEPSVLSIAKQAILEQLVVELDADEGLTSLLEVALELGADINLGGAGGSSSHS